MSDSDRLGLRAGLRLSGLGYPELWLRYLAVGGDAAELEFEAYVLGLLIPEAHQHDLIAQALNESFMECGEACRVGYWDEVAGADGSPG
jgi:hypothetical protein